MDERFFQPNCQQQLQEHLKLVINKHREQQVAEQHAAAIEEQKELICIRNKDKGSAVASTAVKKHLARFVMGRQKDRVIDAYSNSMLPEHAQHWGPGVEGGEFDVCSSSMPLSRKFNFPLRKTASEPNLKVRSRLRQILSSEQRSSPLLPRRDVKTDLVKKIKKKMTDSSSPTGIPESDKVTGSNSCSPTASGPSDSHMSSSFLHEDHGKISRLQDLAESNDLHTSPSLPNLPLGLQRTKLLESSARYRAADSEFGPASYDRDGEPNNAPGPIRHFSRPFHKKSLSRTHSAPTTATSQLQAHLLQKRRFKLLQQKALLERTHPVNLATHLENVDSSGEGGAAKQPLYNPAQFPFQMYPTLAYPYSPYLFQHINYPLTVDQRLLEATTGSSHSSSMLPTTNTVPNPAVQRVSSVTKTFTKPYRNNSSNDCRPSLESSNSSDRPSTSVIHKPLQRTQSSPARAILQTLRKTNTKGVRSHCTGIAYSPVMLQHGCACGDNHVENPGRIKAIWTHLSKQNLVSADFEKEDSDSGDYPCCVVKPRKATTDELQLVHTQEHTWRYGTTSLARKELNLASKFIVLPCGGVGVDNGIDIDTVWNEQDTVNASRMAVGCTIDLSIEVATRRLQNGFAVVRPPGHHAQRDLAMAFCYFNSVAIAARKLQELKLAERILIVDWDVHHCNGTQNIFYNDSSVLVISVHRYDDGNFFPGTGGIEETGEGDGKGYNVNIGFNGALDPPMGDAEYLAVFRTVVMPIAQQYNPDFVFVSCGFSAAMGHPSTLGGYNVTPQCFAYLTYMLSQLAEGKVVMVLEGGFEEKSLCHSTEACVQTLLGNKSFSLLPSSTLNQKPVEGATETMAKVTSIQKRYWQGLDLRWGCMSHLDYLRLYKDADSKIVKDMASLKVNEINNSSSNHTTGSSNNNTTAANHFADDTSDSSMCQDVDIEEMKDSPPPPPHQKPAGGGGLGPVQSESIDLTTNSHNNSEDQDQNSDVDIE